MTRRQNKPEILSFWGFYCFRRRGRSAASDEAAYKSAAVPSGDESGRGRLRFYTIGDGSTKISFLTRKLRTPRPERKDCFFQ